LIEYFRISVEEIQDLLNSGKNNWYFIEDQYTFLIISSSFLLRMRIFQTEIV